MKTRISIRKRILILFLPIILMFANTSVCLANSPPPPSIFIIVSDAPKDLLLRIGSEEARRKDKVFESYFGFFFDYYSGPTEFKLEVTSDKGTFEVTVPQVERFNNTYVLNLSNHTLSEGTSPIRPYEFAFVTLGITLVIEGVIFYLFGYRKRSSWLIFFIVNIVTQGLLYIWLINPTYPSYYNYVAFGLVFGEFFVFVLEIILFLIFIREHRRLRTFSYVILANLASLFAGIFIISALI